MNWEAIGAVGEVAGAVGVIATLGYLALQIRRSNSATSSETIHQFLGDWRDFCREWMKDPELVDLHIRGTEDFQSLSREESHRYFLFMLQFVFQAQIADEMNEQGTLSKYDRDVWVNFVVSSFNSPGGREVWRQCSHIFTPRIAGILTEGLENMDPGKSWMARMEYLEPRDKVSAT